MGNVFRITITITFILGIILSKSLPISAYILSDKEVARHLMIEAVVIGAALVYVGFALWKYMRQRIWVKILLISGILFWSLIIGYLFTGFIVQPILLSTSWTAGLLAGNDSNIVWYWPFGFSITTCFLYMLTKAIIKIIRGETFLF
jgi:hypothetical protein